MTGDRYRAVCTFISYESVEAINSLEHLAHINDTIIADYEERAETSIDSSH